MTEWQDWVGHRSTSTAYLDPEQANRMAVTLDRLPTFKAGDDLPPAWHWLYFHDLVQASRLGGDGHPALGVTMPPVPLPRRMWAAGSLEFSTPMALGQVATRTSTIKDIVAKDGRSGPLYFVTVEHDVRAPDGEGVRESQTIVYRDLDTNADAGATPPTAPGDGEFGQHWSVDSTTLFRYSALTFNGHRIHYDLDYARDIEGYPGLVIHGPLLATLLMDLASSSGRELATFGYRARSPLFVPEDFVVQGRSSKSGAALWAASTDGRLAMDGTATYKETA